MDPKATVSPLLSPRPDFLGAGWGRERANTFLELLSLSFLPLSIPSSYRTSKVPEPSAEHVPNLVESTSSSSVIEALDLELCCTPTATHHSYERILSDAITHNSTLQEKLNACGSECNRKHSCHTNNHIVGESNYCFKEDTITVFELFQQLKIPFETEIYRPKDERLDADKNIFYCKNLFLKDRKGQFYLLIFHEDTEMDLKQLRKTLNACRNFCFATAEDMMNILHTEPGGVTPLALMHESARRVIFVVSNSLVADGTQLMFHPMDASLATKIRLQHLLRFLKHFGHTVRFID